MVDSIYIIIDNSGSISGLRKKGIVKNLLLTMGHASKEATFSGVEFKSYLWSQELTPLDGFVPPSFGKANNIQSLLDFINEAPAASRFLLLSDGGINPSEAREIKALLQQKGSFLFALGLGADCDMEGLMALCQPDHRVYASYDVLNCLRAVCFESLSSNPTNRTVGRFQRRARR